MQSDPGGVTLGAAEPDGEPLEEMADLGMRDLSGVACGKLQPPVQPTWGPPFESASSCLPVER